MLSSDTSRPTRTTPRAAAAVLAAVVLLAACGGGKKDDDETGSGVDTSTTVGLLNPDGTPAVGGDGPGSGAAPSTVRTPGPSVEPERTDIPLAGRYLYAYTSGAEAGEDRIYDIHDTGERRGHVRQQTYFGAGSSVVAQVVVWFGTDLYYAEAEQRTSGGRAGALCSWNPQFVELDLPLAVGKTWKADSTCSTDGGSRRRVMQARVSGQEDIEVGGVRAKVWVIERTIDTRTEAKGTNVTVVTEDRKVTTDRVTVDRHLLARSSGTESSSLNGVPKGSATFTLALKALNPSKLSN